MAFLETRGSRYRVFAGGAASLLATLILGGEALAQDRDDADARIEAIEQELQSLKTDLAAANRRANQAVRQANAADNSKIKWHLAGFAQTQFVTNDSNDPDEPDTTFGNVQFNPVFHFQYDDLLLFEGELEFEAEDDGGTDVELEFSTLNLFLNDYMVLEVGKMLSPIGVFQQSLHPAWINKLPDRPAGFVPGGAEPLSDVGLQLRGGVPVGPVLVTYGIAVTNGPQIGEDGGLELEGFGEDNNDNKAVGGRVSILPLPFIDIGFSYMTAKVKGREAEMGPVTNGNYDLWGVDAAFTRGPWDIRGEYINSELDSFFGLIAEGDEATSLIPGSDWETWYVQGAYQLSGITDFRIVRNLELVARFSEVNVEGFDEFIEEARPEERWTGGINYLLTASFIAKASISRRNFDDPDADDTTEFRLQLAYGF